MPVSSVAKVFAGSCVVYLVMAACSAYSDRDDRASSSSSGDPPAIATVDGPVPNALAEGFKSGSRLKLRFWEGADGSRQFLNFFDTQLQTDCWVGSRRTSDGKIRCLPAPVGTLYFSDAACKTPAVLAVAKDVDPQPKIASVSGMNDVAEQYALMGLVNAPTTTTYRGGFGFPGTGDGGCGESAVPAGANYYQVGAPMAPSSFVEMTIKNE